ncbi:MAG: tRNA 5-methoxyuridine(34)/uridine 5-oxyacetic acid(34) synthase CmoB, partial [Campylobacterales bacterium]|nr:tRNA 5-methoxyuridine(34)/uridine 5-oxyacetic acid(34) synthase CmoB [Campylobacterales bacterium]
MTNIDSIRQERLKWLTYKDIAPIWQEISKLSDHKSEYSLGDVITITTQELQEDQQEKITKLALAMKPWRKGPFKINSLFIDTEWQSFIKYNLLEQFFNLENKVVGDIGCNNGYYLFRMLEHKPKKLVGFDPSALFYTQFSFINHFIKSDIVYELLGVEHLGIYEHKFDVLFCLGVLYHRSDPISTLKSLYKGLENGGELFLDTFMIDGEEDVALTPFERYSKIPNVYFIPTVNALKNWCHRAGFKDVEILAIKTTDETEQRKTDWIDSQSLEDFLDPQNPNLTVEGYPAPKRV